MKQILFLILIAAISTSCGGKKGKTETKLNIFHSKIAGLGTDADGGLMLWGKGPTEDWGQVVDTTADEIVLTLDNGSWSFWAVAWSGPGAMQGIPKCAQTNITLDGGDVGVDLTLSNANCELADFSLQPLNGVTGSKTFPQIDIVTCNQLSGITNQTDHTTECSISEGKKGYVLSYEIVYPDFSNDLLGENELVSDCQMVPDADATPTAFFASLPVPGNGLAPMGVIIRGYYDSTDCGTTNPEKGFIEDYFPNGINQNQVAIRYNSGTEFIRFHQLTTTIDVCQGERLDTTLGSSPFASGRGDNRAYTICTEEQFNSIGSTNFPTYNADTFVQLTDLNFSFNPFDPFVPIGDDLESFSAASTTFVGTYDGRNNKISGIMVMEQNGKSELGMIRKMGTGTVANLTLNNAVVESDGAGSDNIGLVIGEAIANTTILNVKVHGHVKGEDNVGGIVGNISNAGGFALERSHAAISGDAQTNLGGLIGSATNPDDANFIHKSSASVDLHSNAGGFNQVGGLVGSVTGSGAGTKISKSFSTGLITGNQNLGGIAGQIDVNLLIEDVYSTASIKSNHFNTTHNIGGLVGQPNSASITRAFATFGYQVGQTGGGNDNNIGGATGDACTPTNVSYTGNPGSAGCGTQVTVNQISSNSYTSTSFSGAISFSDTTQTWYHPTSDDGYDFPRLSWELQPNPDTGNIVENEVPYLQRPCSGNFAVMAGSGTSTDPYQICKASDFMSMSTGTHYVLNNNIDLGDEGPADRKKFATGIYHVDGLGHRVHNYQITQTGGGSGFMGFFESLNTGSNIENIKFGNFNFNLGGTPSGAVMAGLLAGASNATITNVDFDASSILVNHIHQSTQTSNIGGLIGTNYANGSIDKISAEVDFQIDNANLSNVNSSDLLQVGGLVFDNQGTVNNIEINGHLSHNAAGGVNDTRDGVKYSGMAVLNSGTMQKVHSRLGMNITNNASGAGDFTLMVEDNSGTLRDLYSEGDFNFTNVSGTATANLLFKDNTGGTVERAIQAARSMHNTDGAAKTAYGTGAAPIDFFCTEPSAPSFTGCFSEMSLLYSTTKGAALDPPITHASATSSTSLAFGDIDGDGYDDLVTGNNTNDSISVFTYNSVSGSFNPPAITAVSGSSPDVLDIKVVDLDDDGDLDVVVATTEAGNGTAYFLSNNGAGSFTQTQIYNVVGFSKKIDFGDFNGDGDMDIVVLRANNIYYLDNDGAENFAGSAIGTVGAGNTRDFKVADFDSDGMLDIAYTDYGDDQIEVLLNNTAPFGLNGTPATFAIVSGGTSSATDTGPTDMAMGDITGDGIMDFIVNTSSEPILYYGNGDGSFTSGFHLNGSPNDLIISDLNGDGDLDFIGVEQPSGIVEIVKGLGTFYFGGNSIYDCPSCNVVGANDFDQDGYNELVTIDSAGGFAYLWFNQGVVTDNLVTTSNYIGVSQWDIHHFTEVSEQNPLDISATWMIHGDSLEPGWSEGGLDELNAPFP
ncbi:MAG: hypothetical protein CME70_02030 [Halobacteriovorax sp.]|nr:hypothetical protein [Halobacteriovorax sp.]|tara:strand:- start:14135 stop:18574 length:4440 start_codon:yes stop_codon:yes gene_type:complete